MKTARDEQLEREGIRHIPTEVTQRVGGVAIASISEIQGLSANQASAPFDWMIEAAAQMNVEVERLHSPLMGERDPLRGVLIDEGLVFIPERLASDTLLKASAINDRLEELYENALLKPAARFTGFRRNASIGPATYSREESKAMAQHLHANYGRVTNEAAFDFLNGYVVDLLHNANTVLIHYTHLTLDALSTSARFMSLLPESLKGDMQKATESHDVLARIAVERNKGTISIEVARELATEPMENIIATLVRLYDAQSRGEIDIHDRVLAPGLVKLFLTVPDIARLRSQALELYAVVTERNDHLQEELEAKNSSDVSLNVTVPKPATVNEVSRNAAAEKVEIEKCLSEYERWAAVIAELQGQYGISKKILKNEYGELWRALSGSLQPAREFTITGILEYEAHIQIGILYALAAQLRESNPLVDIDMEFEEEMFDRLTQIRDIIRETKVGYAQLALPRALVPHYRAIYANWSEYRDLVREFPGSFSQQDLTNFEAWFTQIWTTEKAAADMEDTTKETDKPDEPTENPFPEGGGDDDGGIECASVDEVAIFTPQLEAVAEQLNWEVLPPGSSDDVMEAILDAYDDEYVAQIDWQRIENLVRLRDIFGGRMYRGKSGALGSKPPFFVIEAEIEDRTVAIAETALEHNATYLMFNDLAAGTWQEVLALVREDARDLGARRVYHRREKDHLNKILHALRDLLTLRPF